MGLDGVELIVEAEKFFGVAVPDERLVHTDTVGEFARLLADLRFESGSPLAYEEVLRQLRQIISQMFNIPLEDVSSNSHFVDDLGLNQ